MKGTNDSCREVLEAKTEKKLPTRHNLGGLPSPGLVLPHPYARIPVFSPFKSILSGDSGRKKCWDPKSTFTKPWRLTRRTRCWPFTWLNQASGLTTSGIEGREGR